MNNKAIERTARKLIKELKGNINFSSVEKYLKAQGYRVIFFNTPAGDRELLRYGFEDKGKAARAFTYIGSAKIIFIDNAASPEDKTYLLYHEAGHIMLGHLDLCRLGTNNSILLDMEADTFAHFIINPPKTKNPLIFLIDAILILFMLLTMGIFFISSDSPSATSKSAPITGITNTASDISAKKVYVTRYGEHYHRENCIYVKGKNTVQLNIEAAQKQYSPCKVCEE